MDASTYLSLSRHTYGRNQMHVNRNRSYTNVGREREKCIYRYMRGRSSRMEAIL